MTSLRRLLQVSMLLFLSVSVDARQLRGDWESSGDLPYIYTPKYPFAYACQLEVSDFQLHSVEGENRRVYAVAQVTLDSARSSVSVEELRWVPVIRDFDAGTDREIAGPLPYAVHAGHVGLSFNQMRTGDEVNLYASIGLHAGGFAFADDGRATFKRTDKVLRTSAEVGATSVADGERLYRRLYVECDKIK